MRCGLGSHHTIYIGYKRANGVAFKYIKRVSSSPSRKNYFAEKDPLLIDNRINHGICLIFHPLPEETFVDYQKSRVGCDY